jgi:hypothetical protein
MSDSQLSGGIQHDGVAGIAQDGGATGEDWLSSCIVAGSIQQQLACSNIMMMATG